LVRFDLVVPSLLQKIGLEMAKTSATDGAAFQAAYFACHPGVKALMDLFDCLPGVFFYAKDLESRFVRVNRANQAIYGVDCEEPLLGKTDRDFHPPVLAEAYIAEDQRVLHSRQPNPNQTWLVPYLHGPLQWFVSSKTPLFDEHGDVIGLAGVMYPIATPTKEQSTFGRLDPAIRYLEEHYFEDTSMAELARLCRLSSTHFNRQFRHLLKMSPSEYLLALRVQQARSFLAMSSKTVAEVAAATGFYDQSHFTKRFRSATGMTPRKYRQRFQE
jgi:AraC-like DNA-binding protein